MGELPKKKKRKKAKKKSPSKPRFALDVARNPKPYEIPLYFPPFPSVINHQPKVAKEVFRVENLLRNYMGVNSRELQRLGNNMTAYRQEAQTAFRQNVAFPRATVNVGDDEITGTDISDIGSVTSSVSPLSAHDPDSDYTPSASSVSSGFEFAGKDRAEPAPLSAGEESSVGMGAGGGDVSSASNLSFGRAEGLVADMERILDEGFQSASDISAPAFAGSPTDVSDFPDTSAGEETIMRKAGRGAGRLTEPDYTTDTSVGSKSVRFNPVLEDFMDLTSGGEEGAFAPRATRQQRAQRRERRYVDNAMNRRLGRVGLPY